MQSAVLSAWLELKKLSQLFLTIAAFLLICQPGHSQLVNLRHWTGQGVSPVFEGYDTNPDGSFNMWFGYMNRNYEEEIDIPVGPENRFDRRALLGRAVRVGGHGGCALGLLIHQYGRQ